MTKPLPEILEEIEARCNAATPGPWRIKIAAQLDRRCVHSGRNIVDGQLIGTSIPEQDATFIAAARTDVTALVKALRMTLEYVLTSDPRWADVESELAALLSEQTEKQEKKDL